MEAGGDKTLNLRVRTGHGDAVSDVIGHVFNPPFAEAEPA
jgi:hypothetical protein